MALVIDRRALLTVGGFGLAGLILPGGALAAQALLTATGFTHNVASGEPGPESMLLWTRYVPAIAGPTKVRVEISDSAEFTKVISGGQMVTGPWRDYTVKITASGLLPNTRYHYRFISADGTISPTGRTKTLPIGKTQKFNFAVFSCANLGFGHFNAYGHAAARGDIDAVLHMGDYIYEYGSGGYDAGAEFASRIMPQTEIFSLADYRMRYASYRMDADLQAVHANFPMIIIADDHESANDAWEGGAQNHQETEGDWSVRRNAAVQVWREWLPVGEQPWKAYEIGDLATYYRTDTRTLARSRPPGADTTQTFGEFKAGEWIDDAATMMGSEQEQWLYRQFARNTARWTIAGVGTNVGYSYTPKNALDWLAPDADKRGISYVKRGITAANAGLPSNMDNWGGYPKARSRLLSAAQRTGANLIMVTGDSHNGWAFNLPEGGKPAGVEFGGHSVTSPGIESITGTSDPKNIARDMVGASPELAWMDTSNRGYMMLSLSHKSATNEWVFMDSVKSKSLATKPSQFMRVRAGRNVLDGL